MFKAPWGLSFLFKSNDHVTLKSLGKTSVGWPRITNRRELSLRRLESKSSRLCSKNLVDDRNKKRVVETLNINTEKHVTMSWTLTVLKLEKRDVMLLANSYSFRIWRGTDYFSLYWVWQDMKQQFQFNLLYDMLILCSKVQQSLLRRPTPRISFL